MEKQFSGQIFGITGYHHYIRRFQISRISKEEDVASKWIKDYLGTKLLFSFPTFQYIEQDLLHAIIVQNGGFIGNKDIWQHDQIIIVGEYGYDERYLEKSIRLSVGSFCNPEGDQIICKAQYFSAEAFVHFYETGEYPHY